MPLMNDVNTIFTDEVLLSMKDEILKATKKMLINAEKTKLVFSKGKITSIKGTTLHAFFPGSKYGQLFLVYGQPSDKKGIFAEVIAIEGNNIVLQLYTSSTEGISCSGYVEPADENITILVGDYLKGSVVDGLGEVMLPGPEHEQLYHEAVRVDIKHPPPSALSRKLITEPLSVGVRGIDTLMTLGKGQRIGLFGYAGTGKSMLLSMITRFTQADLIVIALIGERGREVNEFLEVTLNKEDRKNCIAVISTADRPAIEKLKAAYTATRIAEHFRDQGKEVLLIVDSLTRFCRADRDVVCASGEYIPAHGFPPSVFSKLAFLLERVGPSEYGSITAIYTVLLEGEGLVDALAAEVRSLLDGHITLSKKLSEAGCYPAIDVSDSISRLMKQVTTLEMQNAAKKLRRLLSRYKELELLIQVGEYTRGENLESDEAVDRYEAIMSFIQQDYDTQISLEEAFYQLYHIVG